MALLIGRTVWVVLPEKIFTGRVVRFVTDDRGGWVVLNALDTVLTAPEECVAVTHGEALALVRRRVAYWDAALKKLMAAEVV